MLRRSTIPAMLLAVLALFSACFAARAQVEPAATGGRSTAKLDYDLSYAETATFFSGNEETDQRGIASGEVEYLNGKERTPFSLTYSGGYIFGISGIDTGTGVFQHFLISQGFVVRHGAISLTDNFGLYPGSPTTGFSGIPGVGTFPGLPEPPIEPILALTTRMLNNTADATVSHSITYNTNFSFTGDYETLRFPAGGGLDTNQVGLLAQINWHLNALSSASVLYNFSRSTYLGSPFTIETQSIEPGYTRAWSRWLKTSASGGPELIHSNNDLVVPPSTGIAANAQVTYTAKSQSASLNYQRSVTAGAEEGSTIGIRNNDASANFSRTFGKNLSIGATGSYFQTQGLVQTGVVNGKFGGVNVTRRFGEDITLSANYTAIVQTSSLSLPSVALQGLVQEFGFNIAYHPRETHIIRH